MSRKKSPTTLATIGDYAEAFPATNPNISTATLWASDRLSVRSIFIICGHHNKLVAIPMKS